MIDAILGDMALDIREFIAQRKREGLPADSPEAFRELLNIAVTQLDWVSREEFDAQQRLLEQACARVDQLQQQLDELEKASGEA